MPFDDPIVAGNVLIRQAIQSPDYVVGVSGWAIKRDGTVEFNNGTFRGSLIIGTSPNPRIQDATSGDAALTALQAKYVAAFIIGAARLYYFNATDFYFEAVGMNTTSGKPELRTGEFFPGTNSLTAYEFYTGGTATDATITTYGSAGNVGGTQWLYRNGIMRFQPDAKIRLGLTPGDRTVAAANKTFGDVGPAAVDTIAATPFATLKGSTGAAISVPFEKQYGATDTDIVVVFSADAYCTTSSSGSEWRVLENNSGTTPTKTLIYTFNTLADHRIVAKTFRLTGLAAGTLDLRPQWSRRTGTGTFNRDVGSDLSMHIMEVSV